MAVSLAHTPLHPWHVSHGGRMVEFAGWDMPVQYTSIVAEHCATRERAALFDVSHMGRFRFDGPGAATFLDGLVTRRVANLAVGQIRYALVTNPQGGILDDVLVYHLAGRSGEPFFWLVVNAANRDKIAAWMDQHLPGDGSVKFSDRTDHTAMIAVQGPRALEVAGTLVPLPLAEMRYYTGATAQMAGYEAIVSRTGYTGEDGCEIVVPAEKALGLWESLLSEGQPQGIVAAGLAARDTLRLEAAMPLYGHELSEAIDPIQAGLEFAVNLQDRRFPGCEVLARRRADAPHRRRVGLAPAGKRVARQSAPVLHQGAAWARSPVERSRPPCKSRSPWPTCNRSTPQWARN